MCVSLPASCARNSDAPCVLPEQILALAPNLHRRQIQKEADDAQQALAQLQEAVGGREQEMDEMRRMIETNNANSSKVRAWLLKVL